MTEQAGGGQPWLSIHIASFSGHLETCYLLLDRITEIDREAKGMMEGWRGVEEGEGCL